MKIWHVLHGFRPEIAAGGTERAVEAMARAMQADGHEVTIVCGSLEAAPSQRVDELDVDGLRVLRLHRADLYFEEWYKTWSPDLGGQFRRLVNVEQPDVVHVHHWIRLSSDLVRRARAVGCPTIAVTMHDYFTTFASPVRRADEDAPEPPACAAHVGRRERIEALRDHRDDMADEVRAADLRYAPCAAHAAGLQETAPCELGAIRASTPPMLEVPARLPEREVRGKKLVTWGSLYPDKGLDLVLDAMFSIGGGWTLDVYGEAHDPAYRERLHAKAANMPVTFHGAFTTEDLGGINADYAVLPSMCHESYGLTLDEAQCLGLPIIAADLPAYRERAPAESTLFFAAADPGELAMLLLDDVRLAGLKRPAMPTITTAASAARALLDDYAGATRVELEPARMTVAHRLRALFRRAEWRQWSVLQQAEPKAPPRDFDPS